MIFFFKQYLLRVDAVYVCSYAAFYFGEYEE